MPDVPIERAIPFVAAAYIGIWVLLFGYLVVVGRRVGRLHQELKLLKEHLNK